MSDAKSDATESETAPTAAASGKKSHFKRFWWAYLLAFLVIATVIVVPSV